jgi:hypothetical protein
VSNRIGLVGLHSHIGVRQIGLIVQTADFETAMFQPLFPYLFFIILYIGALHSSWLMDFNNRRGKASNAYLPNPKMDQNSSHNGIMELAQRNPYERPRLRTQGSMETARSTAD